MVADANATCSIGGEARADDGSTRHRARSGAVLASGPETRNAQPLRSGEPDGNAAELASSTFLMPKRKSRREMDALGGAFTLAAYVPRAAAASAAAAISTAMASPPRPAAPSPSKLRQSAASPTKATLKPPSSQALAQAAGDAAAKAPAMAQQSTALPSKHQQSAASPSRAARKQPPPHAPVQAAGDAAAKAPPVTAATLPPASAPQPAANGVPKPAASGGATQASDAAAQGEKLSQQRPQPKQQPRAVVPQRRSRAAFEQQQLAAEAEERMSGGHKQLLKMPRLRSQSMAPSDAAAQKLSQQQQQQQQSLQRERLAASDQPASAQPKARSQKVAPAVPEQLEQQAAALSEAPQDRDQVTAIEPPAASNELRPGEAPEASQRRATRSTPGEQLTAKTPPAPQSSKPSDAPQRRSRHAAATKQAEAVPQAQPAQQPQSSRRRSQATGWHAASGEPPAEAAKPGKRLRSSKQNAEAALKLPGADLQPQVSAPGQQDAAEAAPATTPAEPAHTPQHSNRKLTARLAKSKRSVSAAEQALPQPEPAQQPEQGAAQHHAAEQPPTEAAYQPPQRRSQMAAAVQSVVPQDPPAAPQDAPAAPQSRGRASRQSSPVQAPKKEQQPEQRTLRSAAVQPATDAAPPPVSQSSEGGIPMPRRNSRPLSRHASPAARPPPEQATPQDAQPAAEAGDPAAAADAAGAAPASVKAEAGGAVPSAGLSALVEQLVAVLNPQPGAQVGLRQVMTSGLLTGQALAFCDRQKQPKISGTVSERGVITCGCEECGAGVQFSSSEWEVHAGSRERRPAESIYISEHGISLREVCLAVQAGAAGLPLQQALQELPSGTSCTSCGRAVQGAAPRLCRACGAAARAANKRSLGEGDLVSRKSSGGGGSSKAGGVKRASSASIVNIGKAAGGGGGAAKARTHMAQPTARGVTGARAERSTHRHKKLFTSEPGALTASGFPLSSGEAVEYKTSAGERLLAGVVLIDDTPGAASGILCDCCNAVISCSLFEAHAGKGSRRAPYDNICTSAGISLRRLAEMMPCNQEEPAAAPQPERLPTSAAGIAGRCEEVIAGLEEVGGGCTLCDSPDFQRGAFGERTMLLCDQCEREFHVGCLRSSGRCILESLPEGDWFCSAACSGIHTALREHVKAGVQPLVGEHSWQLMRGKDGSHATTWALKAAREILSESFDPIIDVITARDMLAMMVLAQAAGPWDYTGMHCALLRHKGKPVAAALVRVFGHQLAELPLVATRYTMRRQGHAHVLITAVEGLLAAMGVQTLCLPAAQETVGTWMHGFAFGAMPEEQVGRMKKRVRMLLFPGSTILSKRLPGAPAPPPSPCLPRAPEDGKPADGAPSSASEQAAEPVLMELDAQPSAAADQAGTGAEQRPQQPPAVADQAGEASEQPPEQPPPQPPRPKQQPPEQQPPEQQPRGQRPSEQQQPAQPSSSAVASPEPGAEAAIEAEAAPGAEAEAAAQPQPGAEAAAEAVPGAEAEAAAADPGAGAKRSGAGAEGGAPAVDHGGSAAERPASTPAAATADAAVNDAASSEEPPEQRPAAPDNPRPEGGGKRRRLDRLRYMLGLGCGEEPPAIIEAEPRASKAAADVAAALPAEPAAEPPDH